MVFFDLVCYFSVTFKSLLLFFASFLLFILLFFGVAVATKVARTSKGDKKERKNGEKRWERPKKVGENQNRWERTTKGDVP